MTPAAPGKWPPSVSIAACRSAGQDGWTARAIHRPTRLAAIAFGPDPQRAAEAALADLRALVDNQKPN